MKNIVFGCCVAFILGGCALNNGACSSKSVEEQKIISEHVQTLVFKDEMGGKINLISSDNFETAILVDKTGREYYLKRQPSGSGIYLEDENGTNIHFKGDDGIVEFKKFASIPITLVK